MADHDGHTINLGPVTVGPILPRRIQLQRRAGWRKPEGAIVVARPSRWGNPYRLINQTLVVHDGHEREWLAAPGEARGVAVRLFREDLWSGRLDFTVHDVRADLAGYDLACWCPLDQPCHADVLLELANPQPDREVAGLVVETRHPVGVSAPVRDPVPVHADQNAGLAGLEAVPRPDRQPSPLDHHDTNVGSLTADVETPAPVTIQGLDDLHQLPAGTQGRLVIGPRRTCATCGRDMAQPIDPTNPRDHCTSCRALTRTTA